ncbi:MAG: Lysyl oxidase [Crocinitomicaceae bacterium]|jgi:hypothetical protein|nr:Lysyl oxidase [Crocinitomicaceae bacterium]
MKKILFSFLSLCFALTLQAQCGAGEKLVEVQIVPDSYPDEISWVLNADGITVLSGTFNSDQICVPEDACLQFIISDSYGDGICCTYGEGSFNVLVDGVSIGSGGQYTTSTTITNGCAPGAFCSEPLVITEGTYTAPQQNYWYSFTPAENGMYDISTCGLSACDTKIWIYGECNGMITSETNVGTLFFDDNEGGCGNQAVVHGYFQAGTEYLIRIGLATGAMCGGGIDFELSYEGPVVGCMDPTACNYNPLATVSDNSCVYFPSPDCTGGPDLMIVEPAIVNSLNIRQQEATNCMVEEGCMAGYGQRTILAFDTHIKNIGDMDYYIGDPTNNPDQFTFQNCHGHAHYEGYADYILYKPNGTSIPIGHKNGFCVLDLECNDGGIPQYSCGNMGISKQCGDIYNSGLDCQWIDITDVDTGEYIMAVKVNWDQSPDALGRYETNYTNNWGQACVRITMDEFGNKGYEMLDDCEPYVDCAGTPYGNSVIDCNGDCGGSAIRGDLNTDLVVQSADAGLYTTGILAASLPSTSCNEVTADGMLSVWDAAVINKCALGQTSNACEFPKSAQNLDQYAEVGYIELHMDQSYLDVFIKNPENRVLGYELNFSGIEIADVENLIDPASYPIVPQFQNGGTKVIGLSYVDSMIPKNFQNTPLLRVYFSEVNGDDICLESIVHLLNNNAQPVNANLLEGCVSLAGVEERGMPGFAVKPNPASNTVAIELKSKIDEKVSVSVTDALGRKVLEKEINAMETGIEFDVTNLTNGFYNVILSTGDVKMTKKIIVKH